MKTRVGMLVVFALLTVVLAPQAMAAENMAPTPADVALLTGLRGDTGDNPAGLIAARVGPIFLHREPNDRQMLARATLTGTVYLDASELDLTFATGYDFTLEGQFGAFGAEIRYFGVPEWSSSRGGRLGNGIGVYYNHGLQAIVLSGDTLTSGSYDSRLHSFELNAKWYPTERLSILAGPRYFELDEELVIEQVSVGGIGRISHDTETTNTLIGVQVGVEGVFFSTGGFSADGWLKAGYFMNDSSSEIAIVANSLPLSYTNNTANRGTFVGDLGVNLNYAVTPRLLVTAGYQLLWIENAVLAPQQPNSRIPGLGIVWTADDVLYQGIRAGVIFMFDICEKPAAPPAPAPVIEPKLEPMTKN